MEVGYAVAVAVALLFRYQHLESCRHKSVHKPGLWIGPKPVSGITTPSEHRWGLSSSRCEGDFSGSITLKRVLLPHGVRCPASEDQVYRCHVGRDVSVLLPLRRPQRPSPLSRSAGLFLATVCLEVPPGPTAGAGPGSAVTLCREALP